MNARDELGAIDGQEAARAQEERGLDQRVVERMQQSAVGGRAAQARAKSQQTHVFDAGIGQQSFEVGLPDDEGGGDKHG